MNEPKEDLATKNTVQVYRRHDPVALAVLWGGVVLFPALIALLFATRADSADTASGFLPPFAVATALMALGLLQQKFNRLEVNGDSFTFFNWLGNKTASFTRADVLDIEFNYHRNNQSLWVLTIGERKLAVPDEFKGVRAVMEGLIRTLPDSTPLTSAANSEESESVSST